MSAEQGSLAWRHSITEATLLGGSQSDGMDVAAAWSHLLRRLDGAAQTVDSDPASRNPLDRAAGIRHLLVLLAAGLDEALRFDPDPVLRIQRASTDDVVTWGMECPDCLYTRATMRGGESYRLYGNRGSARYVGLQTMNGIASTANALVDELEVGPNGDFEVVLSAEERDRNWMPIEGAHPTLTVRHFFYDWDNEVPSSLHIERLGSPVRAVGSSVAPDIAVSRQLVALGDFVNDNLQFFLQFGGGATQRLSPRSTARPSAPPRKTSRSSAAGSWTPTRRSSSKSFRQKAFTGATRSAIHGGRPSITAAINRA